MTNEVLQNHQVPQDSPRISPRCRAGGAAQAVLEAGTYAPTGRGRPVSDHHRRDIRGLSPEDL